MISFLQPDDLQPITGQLNALAGADAAFHDQLAALEARVAALEVVPPPPPPPPTPTELNLQLLGGWRLTGEFSRGHLAIDHATMRAFVVGHAQRNEVNEYKLPAMGVGADVNTYPKVVRTNLIPGFWQGGYGSGIVWDKTQLKVAPKKFYDTAPPTTTTIYAQDGTTQVVNVPRQRFGGFVKSATGYELGSGGYESGQGFAMGPTLASLDGTKLIDFPQNAAWAGRCPRDPNYWPVGADDWTALKPVDGKGVWACDRVFGGGLRFNHGIYYWCWCGIGDIDYKRQNETFAATNKTYLYRFDPVTYKLIDWKEFPIGKVCGQEISPEGKYVYLIEAQAWASGMYKEDPVLKVYEVK